MDSSNKYYSKGMKHYKNQEYHEALKYFLKIKEEEETLLANNRNINPLEITKIYNNIGIIYQIIGNYSKALKYFLKTKKVQETVFHDNPVNFILAGTYNNLGMLYKEKEDLLLAQKYLLKTKKIQETHTNKDNLSLATTYNNLGTINHDLGNYNLALSFLLQAEKIKKTIFLNKKKPLTLALTYDNLGVLYQDLGNYNLAFKYMSKAISIFEKNKSYSDLGVGYANIGNLHSSLGSYDIALTYILKSKNIQESLFTHNHPNIARIYSQIGIVYHQMKNFHVSIKYFNKAKHIQEILYKDNLDNSDLAITYTNLSMYYQTIKKIHLAINFSLKAKKIQDNLFNKKIIHPEIARVYSNLGNLYIDIKEFDLALFYTLRAKKLQETFFYNKYDCALINSNLSIIYFKINNIQYGYTYSNKAYKYYSKYKNNSFSYLNNIEKHQYNKNYFQFLNNIFYASMIYIQNIPKQTKIISQTLSTHWLQYKGTISDFENIITMLYNETNDENIKELIVKREDLRKQLSNLYHSKEDLTKQEFQRKLSTEIEAEITKIETTLAKASTQLEEEFKLEKIDVEMLSSILKENELYIDYANIGDDYYLFTLNNKEEINFIKFDVQTTKEINNMITRYTQEIEKSTNPEQQDKQTTKAILHKLYTLLIEPYKETLFNDDYTTYIISPDGPLGLIPFDALYDGEKYLIETKNITYTPSGKEFVRIRRNQSNQSEKVVVFANPNFDDNVLSPKDDTDNKNTFRSLNTLCKLGDQPFSPLPGTQRELQSIQEIISEEEFTAYSDSSATKENFLKVTDTKILHCATHGFFLNCPDTENPLLKVGIAFSGANIIKEDGSRPHIATGLELASMKLQGTEMVVLSACESAAGEIEHAEGVLGLNKAFIQAGAKTVVASLWKADDKETAEFFKIVYQELNKELDKEFTAKQNSEPYTIDYAKLIRHAKLEFIKNDKHPIFWSGFVVSG